MSVMYKDQPGIYIKYVTPDGKKTDFSHKYETKEMTIDGPSFSVGGIKVTRGENDYHIVIDDKECKEFKGELHFTENEGGGFKFGDDGKLGFTENKSSYMAISYLMPRATVTGNITVKKTPITLSGLGFSSHFQQNMQPHHVAIRWLMMKFHSDDLTLNQTVLVTPKACNGQKVSHGVCVYKNKLTAVTMNNTIEYPETKHDKETGYDVPQKAEYRWQGTTLDGKAFTASISLVPKNLVERVDVLAHLPWLIRSLVKAIIARPYHYQWYDEAVATVQIGEEKFECRGRALHEVTFVNPE